MRVTLQYIILMILFLVSCKQEKENKSMKHLAPQGMVWIEGGTFKMGAVPHDIYARENEKPQVDKVVKGFFIDVTEVTNAQFSKFIEATGYVTTAERKVDWNELKKQLPKTAVKPHDSLLQSGSLSFHCKHNKVTNLHDVSQWWVWKNGASWKHPQGKGSDIKGKEEHPVVHVSYEDALAYCKWANRRLPTEAEWEFAARANNNDYIFTWGNKAEITNKNANTWQGIFPTQNTLEDGFERTAPVKKYPPNNFGLYDMAGNVWEWTQDSEMNNAINKIIKGGSFLCHDSYCISYRISAKMSTSQDTGLEHLGFRTVATPKMIKVR